MKKRILSLDHKNKLNKGLKKFFSTPSNKLTERNRKISEGHKGKHYQTEESKLKISEANRGRIHSEEERRKITLGLLGKPSWNKDKNLSIDHCKKIGLSKKGNNYRKGKHHSEKSKLKMSIAAKKMWAENKVARDNIILKTFINNKMHPNKVEKKLIDILSTITDKFKFCGDGSIWIGRKNPDFINKEGRKIIEMFGDFWHKDEDPQYRIEHFKKFGYDTLVIWEHEIQCENIQLLIDKINGYLQIIDNNPSLGFNMEIPNVWGEI